jgi:hypothetical protein
MRNYFLMYKAFSALPVVVKSFNELMEFFGKLSNFFSGFFLKVVIVKVASV